MPLKGRCFPDALEATDREVWEVDRLTLGGDDPYACNFGPNDRRAVEAFLDYLMLDGAISEKPSVDSLFAGV